MEPTQWMVRYQPHPPFGPKTTEDIASAIASGEMPLESFATEVGRNAWRSIWLVPAFRAAAERVWWQRNANVPGPPLGDLAGAVVFVVAAFGLGFYLRSWSFPAVALLALLVYLDAWYAAVRKRPGLVAMWNLTPVGWLLGTIAFATLVAPAYFVQRVRLRARVGSGPLFGSAIAAAVVATVAVTVDVFGGTPAARPIGGSTASRTTERCSGGSPENPYGSCERGYLCSSGGSCCSPRAVAYCSTVGVDPAACACEKYDRGAVTVPANLQRAHRNWCTLTCSSVDIACGSRTACKAIAAECTNDCARLPIPPEVVASAPHADGSGVSSAAVTPVAAAVHPTAPPTATVQVVLAPADEGFIDTRGGAGWGDRCWNHLKAKQYAWARAACERGLAMDPATPQPKASLLFNMGLALKGAADQDGARRYFEESLAQRENATVRAELESLPKR